MTDTMKIKSQMEERLRALKARAVKIDDSLSELGDDDWAEQAIESADDEVLEKLGGSMLDEIRQIELTLSQIKSGKYGICMGCGRTIVKERLDALPHATKCVKCS